MIRRALAAASLALGLIGAAFLASPAAAGEAATLARQALESGGLAEGDATLAKRLAADPADDEARIGLGLVRFAEAAQHFVSAQYRHGLVTEGQAPVIGMPLRVLPRFPHPEPLSYETQRATLQALIDDLAAVEATLAPLGERDAKVTLDLNAIRLDLGPGAPRVTLGGIIAALPGGGEGGGEPAERFEATFDRGDAQWLRGYSHLVGAATEFALAYDWRDSFDRYAHIFYANPQPSTPHPLPPDAPRTPTFASGEERVADLIGFVHSIRWRCIEPARMARARLHLIGVVEANRRLWPLVLARRGADKHWIAGPQEGAAALPSMTMSAEQVAAWREGVETFDAILDGRKLAPFWRYSLGLDIRKVFEEPRDFDFVDWITGPGAAPYLHAGPTLTMQQWRDMDRVFHGGFLSYLIYVN